MAVGYYGVPRSTLDIDVNVFVPPDHWPAVGSALTDLGLAMDMGKEEIERGEVRIEWEPNSIHLFFSCDPLHDRMRQRIRFAPFRGNTIPLVAPEHLVIRKALLDRTKDWLDIEQILVATDRLDLGEVEDWLERMVGRDNPRMEKLAEVKSGLSLD